MKKISYRKASKKGPTKLSTHTALTSEEEELTARRLRGQKEKMRIEALKHYPAPFDTYKVCSEVGIPYTVEIRSLTNNINSCSCPDFIVNTLCTCKHIEGVLHQLQSKHQRSLTLKSSLTISPQVEIFLKGIEQPNICISWPKSARDCSEIKERLDSFFSANHTLLSDPIMGMTAIEHALSGASTEIGEKIRISSHLQTWLDTEKRKRANQLSREQFLTDVKDGKRSMQMLSAQLYPYQEEGMLHLAFKGRALLADEMGLGKTIQAIAACELLRRLNNIQKVLVITPASLKGEWEEQIAKFTGLPTLMVNGNRGDRL